MATRCPARGSEHRIQLSTRSGPFIPSLAGAAKNFNWSPRNSRSKWSAGYTFGHTGAGSPRKPSRTSSRAQKLQSQCPRLPRRARLI
jgi:hypothetical protein